MDKENEIALIAFNQLIKLTHGHVYVKDEEGRYLYCNEAQAKSLGLKVEDIVGKTDYDLSAQNIAEKFRQTDIEVMQAGKVKILEENTFYNNKPFVCLSTKSPLFSRKNKIIGIAGMSVDITAQKEAEKLRLENIRLEAENMVTQTLLEKLAAETKAEEFRLENEAYLAEKKSQEKVKNFIDKMLHDIQSFRIEEIHEKIGIKPQTLANNNQIQLTRREQQILYFLSLNKSPKEIAQIITTIENKTVSDSTINATINKNLYPKFEVFNIGQLVEKATLFNLIPLLLDN